MGAVQHAGTGRGGIRGGVFAGLLAGDSASRRGGHPRSFVTTAFRYHGAPVGRYHEGAYSLPSAEVSWSGVLSMPLVPLPSSSADRNLLFGILALQMDFISRDQLVTAMNAWVLEKSK